MQSIAIKPETSHVVPAKPLRFDMHHRSPFEAAEKLRGVAELFELRNKPIRARKLRAIAARITLQQQNEVDGFPL